MNTFILSTKIIPDLRKFHNLVASIVPEFDGFNKEDNEITVVLKVQVTQDLINQIEAIIPPPTLTNQEIVQKIIADAMAFGANLISEFAAQNVMMGITQDGMTGTVRKNMSEVISALSTGSLYDAINEVRVLTQDKKDPKYITDVRLLQFINKIEDYLNIPRSLTL